MSAADQCRMTKMSGRITSCCVALLLTFTTVSAVRRELRSINDLNTDSRELLRWFANTVDIDRNGVIRLTFDPNSGDYGSHHYGNFEGLLDQLPRGYRYYTLGNVNQQTLLQVPSQGRNEARLIIRIREQNAGRQSQIIDRVYITQHYQPFDYQRSEYDPDRTYQITTSLLREIRGSANLQSWETGLIRNRQPATARNEQHDFDWLLALIVVFILFIVLLPTANKK